MDGDITRPPDDWRLITWEIGTAELQKSVMAVETFEALRAGETKVEEIRLKIRKKRKLWVKHSGGKWTETASDRFVNEHAWVLAIMNEFGMTTKVDRRTKETSLLPKSDLDARLGEVVRFFEKNEPFEWKSGEYKKPSGW
jgi:hypothetical protein